MDHLQPRHEFLTQALRLVRIVSLSALFHMPKRMLHVCLHVLHVFKDFVLFHHSSLNYGEIGFHPELAKGAAQP